MHFLNNIGYSCCFDYTIGNTLSLNSLNLRFGLSLSGLKCNYLSPYKFQIQVVVLVPLAIVLEK